MNIDIYPSKNTVILKKGDTIIGQVIGQNVDRVQVKVETGKVLEIPKKSILKVLYKEITSREIEAIRKTELAKLEERNKKEEEQKLLESKIKEEELARLRFEREQALNDQPPYPTEKIGLLSSYKIYKSHPTGFLTLASPEAKCSPYSKSSDWYILFGAVAITNPDMGKLLPKESKSIQFRYETSWIDIGATVLGAILVTATRKTLYVDVCEDKAQPKFLTKDELNIEKEIDLKLSNAAKKEKEAQELEESIRLEVELRKIERMRGK